MKMSVLDWYSKKSVFLTGATGFIGKVLIEKMLRVLPELDTIYVLIRSKRQLSAHERLQAMLKLPVFQKLRDDYPKVLNKLVAVEGDITLPGLGVKDEDKHMIYTNVSVVFHGAATLRLEAVLRDSVMHNLIGTRNLLDFCHGIINLQAFVHVSTAFCHCDVEILEEKVYPPTKKPQDVITLTQWLDNDCLELITPRLLGPHPNTYTFTKRLAETLVHEQYQKLPTVIIRPSIVIPTLLEPIPGWVDSLNGPVGVLVGAGKGVIRSMLAEAQNHAEIIPVDIVANSIIIAGWYRANNSFSETPVYNISQSEILPITWGEVLDKGRALVDENPFDWPLWYPGGDIRTNKVIHYLIVFLFQIIPAYFLDFIIFIIGQKTFMIRVQKKVYLGMQLLQYFTLREWHFKINKFLALTRELHPKESAVFYFANVPIDIDDYLRNLIIGTRKYCLKEDMSRLPRAKNYMKFLFVLDRFVKYCFFVSLIWYTIRLLKVILRL